jgi:hypothetical protein
MMEYWNVGMLGFETLKQGGTGILLGDHKIDNFL